jgi:hypothetical protein
MAQKVDLIRGETTVFTFNSSNITVNDMVFHQMDPWFKSYKNLIQNTILFVHAFTWRYLKHRSNIFLFD